MSIPSRTRDDREEVADPHLTNLEDLKIPDMVNKVITKHGGRASIQQIAAETQMNKPPLSDQIELATGQSGYTPIKIIRDVFWASF